MAEGIKLSELTEIDSVPDDAWLYVVYGEPPVGGKITKANLIVSVIAAINEVQNNIEEVEGSTKISLSTGIRYIKAENGQWIEL